MHEQAMARKTMVRRLCPMLDLTVEGEAALAIDENNRLAFSRYALEQNLSQGDLPEPLTDEETDDQDEGGAPDAEIIEDDDQGAGEGGKGKDKPAGKPRGKAAGKPAAGKAAGKADEKPKGKPVGDLAGKAPAKAAETPAEPDPAAGEGSPAKTTPRASRARAAPAKGDDGDLFQSGNGPNEEGIFSGLAEKIRAELASAKDANAVAGVLGIYDPQLRNMSEKFPDLYLTVDEAADNRLAGFGGKS
jgi:hypothetical protein